MKIRLKVINKIGKTRHQGRNEHKSWHIGPQQKEKYVNYIPANTCNKKLYV